MDHIIKFSAGIEREINQTVLHAKDIWHEANPAWDSVPIRVTAGNYAGYGKYVARCYSTGVIEFSADIALPVVVSRLVSTGSRQVEVSIVPVQIGTKPCSSEHYTFRLFSTNLSKLSKEFRSAAFLR